MPAGREFERSYFSENVVPFNTVVFSHSTTSDVKAGKAIVKALVEANPDVKIALLVQGYDSSDPQAKAQLADFYGVPRKNLAPVSVSGSTDGQQEIGLWPQDGFMAGAAGLVEPAATLRHASLVADELSSALGIELAKADYIGMGGDTHFITRPDGEQIAYFGRDTMLWAASALNQSRPEAKLKLSNPGDTMIVIGHIMRGMTAAGVAVENIMPVGVGGRTYGEVLAGMAPAELAQIDPAVLSRLTQMGALPFPESYPTNAERYSYHSDLVMATPDGVNMYVNEDDLADFPRWREQLEFFGYKVIPMPASQSARPNMEDDRTSYLNWIMGVDPRGRTTILLPTAADDPADLTPGDRRAIATLQENNPGLRVIPLGGGTARMFGLDWDNGDRDWGVHCRTNVLPHVIEEAGGARSSPDDLLMKFPAADAKEPV